MKFRLAEYDTIIQTMREKIKALTDPEDTSEDPKPLFENVRYSIPDKISLFGGSLAVIRFRKARLEQLEAGMHESAKIPGAIFILLPGDTEESVLKILRYSDIVGAYLENWDLLGIPGCRVDVLKNDAQNWDVLNISQNPKMPVLYSFSVTGFEITAARSKVVTV